MGSSARVRGCILGGAIGDALGAPCERGGVPADLATRDLRITDDTQLTLATCEAIVARRGVDPAEIAERFADLFRRSQLRGLGASTYKALSELAVGGHWALVGHQGERSAGNGAAMRIAPLAFCCDPSDLDERRALRDVCRITHRHDEAYAGALALSFAIHAAWTGAWSGGEGLLELASASLPDTLVRDRLREIASERPSLGESAKRFGAGGYVVESVPLALRAAETSSADEIGEVLSELVGLGGDSDTLASMAGQVLGTAFGEEALPRSILERIEERAEIDVIAQRFADYITLRG